MTKDEDIEALKCYINDLHDALSDINDVASIVIGDEWLNTLLHRIPAQSLADRDMQIAEKVREACADTVNGIHDHPKYAASIRSLNLNEVISDV